MWDFLVGSSELTAGIIAGKSFNLLLHIYKTFNFLQHSIPNNVKRVQEWLDMMMIKYPNDKPFNLSIILYESQSSYHLIYQSYYTRAKVLVTFQQQLPILRFSWESFYPKTRFVNYLKRKENCGKLVVSFLYFIPSPCKLVVLYKYLVHSNYSFFQ